MEFVGLSIHSTLLDTILFDIKPEPAPLAFHFSTQLHQPMPREWNSDTCTSFCSIFQLVVFILAIFFTDSFASAFLNAVSVNFPHGIFNGLIGPAQAEFSFFSGFFSNPLIHTQETDASR